MKTDIEELTQTEHLYNHYTRLIKTTEKEIIGLRADNVHFSKIDEALTYLSWLQRSRLPYKTNGKTVDHLKILSD